MSSKRLTLLRPIGFNNWRTEKRKQAEDQQEAALKAFYEANPNWDAENPGKQPEIEKDPYASISFGAESLSHLDALLSAYDWSKILGFELPDASQAFPVSMTFVHKRAREEFEISSVPLRIRLGNNLSWIASKVFMTAAESVIAAKKARITADQISGAWNLLDEFLTNQKWVGTDPPPRATKKTASSDGETKKRPVPAKKAPRKKARTKLSAAVTVQIGEESASDSEPGTSAE